MGEARARRLMEEGGEGRGGVGGRVLSATITFMIAPVSGNRRARVEIFVELGSRYGHQTALGCACAATRESAAAARSRA